MSNRGTNRIITTIAVTFVVLVVVALSGGEKSGSMFGAFGSTSVTEMPSDIAPKSKYRIIQNGTDEQAPSERIYKNEYRPHTTHASYYEAPQEVQHPLIASAKFISKKDQLKKARKRNKALLAKKKKAKNSNGQPFESQDDDDFYEDDEDVRGNMPSGMTALANSAPKATANNARDKEKEEEAKMDTYEYWENPIFVQEDGEAVGKLIQSYQVRKVSNTVFYDIVEDMTHDERPNLREYGLKALSATPSSRSFNELAWIKHNDTIGDFRTSAGTQITSYTDAGRTPYVITTLSTATDNTSRASLEALSVLTATSKKYASVRAQSETSPIPVDTASLKLLETRLDAALVIINEKYVTSSDAKVQSEATKTVAAINDYISL